MVNKKSFLFPAGCYKKINGDFFETATNCTFNEENLTDSLSVKDKGFEVFEEIESLVIIKKEIKSDWATILNQVVLISSVSFNKLVIETNKLTQTEL